MTGDFTRAPDLAFPAERLRQAIVDAAGAGQVELRRRRPARPRPGRRRHRRQPASGRLCLAEGPDPAVARGHRARDRGQRRPGRLQPPRLPLGPPRRARPRRRRGGDRRRPSPAAGGPARWTRSIAHRAEFLTAYQDEAYARRYRRAVARVREAEARRVPGRTDLAEAVARNLFKLMADQGRVRGRPPLDRRLVPAPARPRVRALGRARGPPRPAAPGRRAIPSPATCSKRRYGPWMLRAFAPAGPPEAPARHGPRPVRPHGRAPDGAPAARRVRDAARRADRPARRRQSRDGGRARPLPEQIRGFGHVKEANVAARQGTRGRASGGVPERDSRAAGGRVGSLRVCRRHPKSHRAQGASAQPVR